MRTKKDEGIESPRRSRRAVLAGAAGGVAAMAAQSIVRPAAARAGVDGVDGDVVLGGDIFQNQTPNTTYLAINSSTNNTALSVSANGAGTGVYSSTPGGKGVHGKTYAAAGSGVTGEAQGGGTGVVGASDTGLGVSGTGGTNGIQGATASNFASGVYGENTGGGFGLAGRSNALGGTGVYGEATGSSGVALRGQSAPGGIALKVEGRAVFSQSGQATVTAGTNNVAISGLVLRGSSLALAVVQQNTGGSYVKSATPDTVNGTLTIRLNKAPTVNTRVGWLVIG